MVELWWVRILGRSGRPDNRATVRRGDDVSPAGKRIAERHMGAAVAERYRILTSPALSWEARAAFHRAQVLRARSVTFLKDSTLSVSHIKVPTFPDRLRRR
jgi:hypothetical protein